MGGTQSETSFSGEGGTKVGGKGGWDKKEEVKSAEERDMHEVLVGARRGMACWCSMLLGTLPSPPSI